MSRLVVERASDKLLAGAGFPDDEDRSRARSCHRDQASDFPHRRALPEESRRAPHLTHPAWQPAPLPARWSASEGLVDRDPETGPVDWFGQVVTGALVHRRNGRLNGLGSGEQNYWEVRPLGLQIPKEAEAVIAG